MKFIHLSDLHLGKRVNEFSMIEDQKYILRKITGIIEEERPDGVIIAGDVYDRSVPPAEAVSLFDDFIVKLSAMDLQVFIISGNHDSADRLAFANRLLDTNGIHISPVYDGKVQPLEMKKGSERVYVWMLPFIKPANVRHYYPDEDIATYTDAVRCAISHMDIDKSAKNILITHQFVTGASRSESEEISVGGSDNVDASVFDDFDYVALGHIHGPQNIGTERIRYCGTPLKYSFSEAQHEKSVTIVTLDESGLEVRTAPLEPLRDMAEIKGTYEELTLKSFYEGTTYRDDYMHITLTDEDDVPDAVTRLRVIYRNLMKLDYDNMRTRHSAELTIEDSIESKTPLELFAGFYEQQNGEPMSAEQEKLVTDLIEKIWEGEK